MAAGAAGREQWTGVAHLLGDLAAGVDGALGASD
jgi:hypothetical protein